MLSLTKHESPRDLPWCGQCDMSCSKLQASYNWIWSIDEVSCNLHQFIIEGQQRYNGKLTSNMTRKYIIQNKASSLRIQLYICMSQASDNSYHFSRTAWCSHERQPVTMRFENDKNIQHTMMSGYILYIMQHGMNVTNRFTTNQRGLESRQDQREKQKRAGGVTCDNTTSDLMTTDPSEAFALRAELSSLSDSALAHPCILMPMSPICQSALSPMGENNLSVIGR